MPALAAALALSLVEEAAALSPLDRALRIAAAVTETSVDAVADWPVDARDRALIAARITAFGRHAAVMKDCPACGMRAEAAVDLGDLLAAADSDPWLDWQGRRLALRPPSSRAIAAAILAGTGIAAACSDEAAPPPPLAEAIAATLVAARPLLDVRLGLECPACGHGFAPRFDITACLWADLETAAARLLDDVHALALAYHWPEASILAMTPRRRAAYLDRLAA